MGTRRSVHDRTPRQESDLIFFQNKTSSHQADKCAEMCRTRTPAFSTGKITKGSTTLPRRILLRSKGEIQVVLTIFLQSHARTTKNFSRAAGILSSAAKAFGIGVDSSEAVVRDSD